MQLNSGVNNNNFYYPQNSNYYLPSGANSQMDAIQLEEIMVANIPSSPESGSGSYNKDNNSEEIMNADNILDFIEHEGNNWMKAMN